MANQRTSKISKSWHNLDWSSSDQLLTFLLRNSNSECQCGDGSQKKAVLKHNFEIPNAPGTCGRRRDREMMWTDMGEDGCGNALEIEILFLAFLVCQRKWICPSFTFLFCSVPQWIRWCQPSLERGILTHSTDSNANVFQKYFTDTPINNVYQLSGQKKHPESRQWGHMEWDLFPRRDGRYSLQAWTGDSESINQQNCVTEQNLCVTRNPSRKWRPVSGTYLPTTSPLAFFSFFFLLFQAPRVGRHMAK